MAEERIAIEVEVDTKQAVKSLNSLEAELDQMKDELKGLDVGSQEFNKLARSISKADAEVKDLEKSFEGLDAEGKISATSQALGGLAGSVAGVEGALFLMGGASEQTEEAFKRFAAAFTIAQGVKDLGDGIIGFRKLIPVIKNSAIVQKGFNIVQKAFNAIMRANPIGLVITAVGLLVAGFLALTGGLDPLIDAFKKSINVALKPFKKAIDAAVRALQFLGIVATEEEKAAQKRNEAADKRSKEAEKRSIESLTRIFKERLKREEARKILEKQLNEERIQRQAKVKDEERIFNITKKAIQAELDLKLAAIKIEMNAEQDLSDFLDDIREEEVPEEEIDIEDLPRIKSLEVVKELEAQAFRDLLDLRSFFNLDKFALQQEEAESDEEFARRRVETAKDLAKTTLNNLIAGLQEARNLNIAALEADINRRIAAGEDTAELQQELLKIQEQRIKQERNLALISIAIGTATGIAQALALGPIGFVIGAGIILAGAISARNIIKNANTQLAGLNTTIPGVTGPGAPSGGGGGGGGGLGPNAAAPGGNIFVPTTVLDASGRDENRFKTFVVETDITNTQDRVNKAESLAVIETD